jgi:hypothetical protein
VSTVVPAGDDVLSVSQDGQNNIQNVNIYVNQQAPPVIVEFRKRPNLIYSSTFSGDRFQSPRVLPGGDSVSISHQWQRYALVGLVDHHGQGASEFIILPDAHDPCVEALAQTQGKYFWQLGKYAVHVILERIDFDHGGRVSTFAGTIFVFGPGR